MRELVVIGIGQTPVSENWEKSSREIAGEAIFLALQDAAIPSVDAIYVGNMLSGIISRQENLGPLIADWTGMKHCETMKVEAACGSGAAAFRQALMAVGSGDIESAAVVGVEKMTETRGANITSALATAADADYEIIHGLSFVAINALVMRRYMYAYGWEHQDFAPFSIVAHANACHNPYARLREPISLEDYRKARMVAEPINLLDASPIGDGAAAAVVVPHERYKNQHGRLMSKDPFGRALVRVQASASATDTLAVHSRRDPLWLSAAELSARKAYSQAGVSAQEIDLFELHDAFSIMSAMSLEACGFAESGQAPRLGLDGDIELSGRIPIATCGGLKARGHPVGATGVYQIVEVVQQLRGEAGENQVNNARLGMAQNIGGSGATVLTHILQSMG